jgi:hypothetical protein
MRFIVDECTGPKVAVWLRGEGHDRFEGQFVVVTETQVRFAKPGT